jgi:hypothetical protein
LKNSLDELISDLNGAGGNLPLVLDNYLFSFQDQVMTNGGGGSFENLRPLPIVSCLCGSC